MNSQPRSWMSRSTWGGGTGISSAPAVGCQGLSTAALPSRSRAQGQPRSGPACPSACPRGRCSGGWRSLTSFRPRQNRSKTRFMLPPFSMEMMRVWSSSLIQIRKVFSLLCLETGQCLAALATGRAPVPTQTLVPASAMPLLPLWPWCQCCAVVPALCLCPWQGPCFQSTAWQQGRQPGDAPGDGPVFFHTHCCGRRVLAPMPWARASAAAEE